MAEESQPAPEDLERQVRHHLASLRAAGVEWLPVASRTAAPLAAPSRVAQPATPLTPSPAPPPTVPPRAPASLFADLDQPKTPPQPTPGTSAMTPPQEPPTLTPEQRRHELQLVAEKVSGCTRCAELASTR